MYKKYISEQGEEKIRNFKYKGGSISYSYRYLSSPIAQFFLKNFIPVSLAPNIITLVGLIVGIVGCLSLLVQGIGNEMEPWTLLFFGSFIFIYQTLDNIDGKQARRTKNSSPLGMMIDHGCDAFLVTYIILGVGCIIQYSKYRQILFAAQLGVLFGFWASCWAQYHSKGVMILGRVNAVDDGIPTVGFLGILTYIFGQSFWSIRTPIFDYSFSELMVVFIMISGIFQIISLIKNAGNDFTKDYATAFSHLIHIVLMSASLYFTTSYTNWHQEHFYILYFSLSLTMVRDISYTHLCVVSEERYEQFQSTVIVYIVGYPTYIFLTRFLGIVLFPDWIFLYAMLAFFIFKYIHFVCCAVYQVADALNIKVFKINPPPPPPKID